jgi:hypothetical protein
VCEKDANSADKNGRDFERNTKIDFRLNSILLRSEFAAMKVLGTGDDRRVQADVRSIFQSETFIFKECAIHESDPGERSRRTIQGRDSGRERKPPTSRTGRAR